MIFIEFHFSDHICVRVECGGHAYEVVRKWGQLLRRPRSCVCVCWFIYVHVVASIRTGFKEEMGMRKWYQMADGIVWYY